MYKDARLALGLTRDEVVAELGINPATLKTIEKGENEYGFCDKL